MSYGPDNYMQLCRLCARYDAIKMDIFGDEGKGRNLVDKIQTCLPFQVSEGDKLPKSLCYRCMYNLESFYDFRKKTVFAVAILESCVGLSNYHAEQNQEIKEQFERVRRQLELLKNEGTSLLDSDAPMPFLEPQISFPFSSSEKKFSAEATDVGNSGTSNPIELSMPEYIDVDNDTGDFKGMYEDVEVIEDSSQGGSSDRLSISHSDRYSKGNEELCEQETLHTCGICNKAFSSKGHLALHNKIHVKGPTGSFDRVTTSRRSITQTKTTLDKKTDPNWKSGYYRPYHCDLCDKSYSTAKHRWGHVNICHRGNPLVTCPVCSRIFSTTLNLEEHKKTKHGIYEGSGQVNNNLDVADDTAECVKNSRMLVQHSDDSKSSTQGEVLYTCVKCSKPFKTEKELDKHFLSHTRRPSIESNSSSRSSSAEAGKKTGSESPRRSDLKILSNSNKEISLLKQTLLQNHDLTESKSRKRSPSLDSFSGDVATKKRAGLSVEAASSSCSRRKNSKPRKIERNGEEGNDEHVCEVCSKIFDTLSELEKHSLLHENEETEQFNNPKPFKCLLCEKEFSLRNALSRHFNACHGIDPSEIMDISEYQRQGARKSDADQSGNYQKPETQVSVDDDVIALDDDTIFPESQSESQSRFVCAVCTRDFGDRASLWLHLRYTHKEHAAYACGICLHICENNMHLFQHWKTCHPPENSQDQRRYTCQMCGRQHDSRKKLLAHVLVHNLDNGVGGSYDPEMVVTVNTGFYKSDGQDTNPSVMDYNSTFDTEMSSEFGIEVRKEVPSFSCDLCYKSFPTEDGLVKHKKCAHRLNSASDKGASGSSRGSYQLFFICELCGSSHPSKSERWRHVFRAHNGDPALTCELSDCRKVFPTRNLKQEHTTNHHRLQGATPNVCEICGKLWGTRVDFWKHLMGVHPDCVPLTCGVCLKMFCNVPDLQSHVHANHLPLVGGDFCCDICGRPYSNRSKLSRHRRIHIADGNAPPVSLTQTSEKTPMTDDMFNDKYFSPSGLTLAAMSRKSTASKTNASMLLAPENDVGNLLAGIRTIAAKPKPILFCDACPEMTFETVALLAEHRRGCHDLFPCDLCPKFYGRTSHLWKHVKRVHNNHPEITCSICMRISASKAHLANHIQTKHFPKAPKSESKPFSGNVTFTAGRIVKIPTLYPCQKCSKRFWKRYLLKKHQRHCLRPSKPRALKLGNPPAHKCELCYKVFVTTSRLNDHMKVFHAPQPCDICPDSTFTSKFDLFSHIKENHSDDPSFACQIPECSKIMRTKSDCETHNKQHKYVKYPPTCYLCGEVCTSKAKLWCHLNSIVHKAAIPLTCGICFRYLNSTDELLLHVQELHPKALKAPDTCRICAKTYSSVYRVIDHFTKCHPGFHACRDCLKVFNTKVELKEHNDQGPCKETVEKDSAEFEETKDILEEMQNEAKNDTTGESDELPCEFCTLSFPTSAALMEHTETKHQNDVLYLDSNKTHSFSSAKNDGTGENDDDAEECNRPAKRPRRSYNCEECALVFPSPSDLIEHKKNKHTPLTEEKPYKCDTCNKQYGIKSSWWKHISSSAHKARIVQFQSRSPQTFSDGDEHKSSSTNQNQNSNVPYVYIPESSLQGSLMQNFKTEYDDTSSDIQMEETGNTTKYNQDYLEDLTVKSENVNYDDEHTSSTASINNCSSRLEIRKGPCYCQVCGRDWPARKQLWQHLTRNHRKEAAITCGICMKVCSDYRCLSSHLVSEHPDNFNGERGNFSCRICGRYQCSRSKLITHSSIHIVIGSEPEHQPQSNILNCKICFRPFINEESLLEHEKLHQSKTLPSKVSQSTKTEFRCDICFKICGNIGALMKHRKSHKFNPNELYGKEDAIEKMDIDSQESDRVNEPDKTKDFGNKPTRISSKNKTSLLPPGMKLLIPKLEKQTFFVCDICASVFVTEKALAVHSEIHRSSSTSSSVSNQSDLSQDSVSSFSSVAQSILSDRSKPSTLPPSQKKYYSCSSCKKYTFSSYINLKKHYRFCSFKKKQLSRFQVGNQLLWRKKALMKAPKIVPHQTISSQSSSKYCPKHVESSNVKEDELDNTGITCAVKNFKSDNLLKIASKNDKICQDARESNSAKSEPLPTSLAKAENMHCKNEDVNFLKNIENIHDDDTQPRELQSTNESADINVQQKTAKFIKCKDMEQLIEYATENSSEKMKSSIVFSRGYANDDTKKDNENVDTMEGGENTKDDTELLNSHSLDYLTSQEASASSELSSVNAEFMKMNSNFQSNITEIQEGPICGNLESTNIEALNIENVPSSKDNLKESKDCFVSLEDALSKFEAQNTI